ncbi:hypothetical protein [Clostridium magnum]|uniref:Uncharacterized protein n=1 Tax=Clostridium magnum DSM 2767 TaxID=1121326 RepID=A0A162TZB2_9CLOT|nr:hypothetical protein [Clostridium magnum]KZL93250.1 hypothetical protein CLMAG_02730 [Clostridium magnum DSM 2767]SHI19233.1 hypothetical protein SAMN02745944_03072 [Clostridium magnum DSM 2767]
MDNEFRLTSEDGFFLTFLGAWCSARQQLWNGDAKNILILILTILCFASLVCQIRIWANVKDEKIIKYSSVTCLIVLAVSVCYFMWANPTYLSPYDVKVLAGCCTGWILFPVLDMIDNRSYLTNRNAQGMAA